MTEPDQCIICLESLQPPPPSSLSQAAIPAATVTAGIAKTRPTLTIGKPVFGRIDSDIEILEEDSNNLIATLVGCNHVVHDRCIRSWAKNSNTCPICRTPFNEVSLSSELNGPPVDSYAVQDKKQEPEFDIHRWLEENPEDEVPEPGPICPLCQSGDHEDILLLCDGCNAAYHTNCLELDGVPQTEYWFCFECENNSINPPRSEQQAAPQTLLPSRPSNRRRRGPLRTQQQTREARREARSLEWQGAWDRIASRIYDATDLDIDNHEEDDAFQSFRRAQSQREQIREMEEHRDWEQRLLIASRVGARDAFAQNIRPTVGHRLDGLPVEPFQPAAPAPPTPPPPAPESREEQRAWGALDRARDAETSATTTNARKRKSRSITASPREPPQEPERKLKRPRTRRLPIQGETSASASASASGSGSGSGSASASASAAAATSAFSPTAASSPAASSPAPTSFAARRPQNTSSTPHPQSPLSVEPGPSFLSSLLKEVEMSTPSDDDAVRTLFGTRSVADPSSPVTSPSPSSRNSPRALSITPPPNTRPTSPTSLSSYVEPRFPKANYSPTRASGDSSDSDSRSNGAEIRQPRPQRPMNRRPHLARSQDSSPTRAPIPLEAKERISRIVRAALDPHYRAKELTSEQYSTINRHVSHKLYEAVRDPTALDDDARKAWESIAAKEVTRAVEGLKT
ncbi:PHD and RING finger domain-containing protein [Colletotrichum spinosum]|uniref:PHD and RING finger domain-containing protein n=1 Tax=Colletotrichum spinosum TaxID=1347390 RepID=A0A4R8Q6K9_9PEZI|nr:PHD and RING finger domain-containing protein [Colletotrichum spinosum]